MSDVSVIACSTVATDVLVVKHQAISNHSADYIFVVLNQFQTEILHLYRITFENKIIFWKKKNTQLLNLIWLSNEDIHFIKSKKFTT